jgi:ESCRT-II complex subunit VPS36
METFTDEPGRAPAYPQLLADEVCYPRDERVDLLHPLKREGCQAYLTTHRFLVRAPGGERLAWPYAALGAALTVEKPGLLWDKSWKLLLRDGAGGEAARLAFPGGGHEAFKSAAEERLRAWRERQEVAKRRREEKPPPPPPPPVFGEKSLAAATMEAAQREHEALARAAFQSLDGLRELAKKVGDKAASYKKIIEKRKAAAAGGGGGGGSGADADALLSDILAGMGTVERPVTRETAGSKQYEASLAAEFARIIRPHVARAGGLLPLTDAYCIYNRARGMSVVAPRDLLGAVAVLEGAPHLGLKLLRARCVGDRQRVLQLRELSDEAMVAGVADRLRAAAAAAGGGGGGGADAVFTNAVALAAAAGVPLPVATLQLQLAEEAGAVCRDVSLAGTRYYLAGPFWGRWG